MKIKIISSGTFNAEDPHLAIQDLNEQISVMDNIETFSEARLNCFHADRYSSYPNKVIAHITVKLK